ncbi:MAG: hypothetical protein K0B08_00765 [Bacteroidales bacterium]|nr:hypothetical protein [Bacteroidales bacterium]
MKTFTQTFIKNASFALLKCLFIISMLAGFTVYSQTFTAEFETAGYTLTDLGSITDLPAQYGGLTIRPGEPNTLYIGGSANLSYGLAIVPPGYPGAGNLIFSSYNASVFYRVPYTIDGSGQYILSNQTAQEDVYATAWGNESGSLQALPQPDRWFDPA